MTMLTTPESLDQALIQVSTDIQSLAKDYATAARTEAQKEVAYKLAYAKALLSVVEFKNADERRAKAELMCATSLTEREIACGVAKGAKAAYDAARDTLSALQTRARLLSNELQMLGGIQPNHGQAQRRY